MGKHVKLRDLPHRALTESVVDYLRQNGIDAEIGMADAWGLRSILGDGVKTWVAVDEAQFEEAKELLDAFEAAELVEEDED